MAQQTAVEWLVNHWKKLQSKGEKMSWQQIIHITELAKQMEREQHYHSCVNVIEGVLNKVEKGEKTNSRDVFNQYYTQTYGTTEK